ncbi:MAG TPA: ABC-F family ATP-binding cassette domain-containing protein, partial [Candidatus Krumholzibacteria bacterium]|nr:ABC-F family ATP-binding cassette domain-containing protein [Candidatus Krumholzibacteria bacterium]
MSLISLQDAVFDYQREPILAGVSCAVQPDERIALTGPNGSGKSTLLHILAGDLDLLEGRRETSGQTTVALLSQETTFDPDAHRDTPTRDVVARTAFHVLLELESEMARVGAALADADESAAADLQREHGRLQHEYERRDGYTWRARMEQALQGLGVGEELWSKAPGALSGGERRRAALAAALLSDATVLLLDEPTNHLDLESREWLEAHLARRPGALVMVSHDRWFLDKTCNRTWELTRGKLSTWRGSYGSWVKEAAERRERDEAAYRRQQDKIADTEAFIRKNLAGQKTKQAQSRRKQLEKVERLDRPGGEQRKAPIVLAPSRPGGATPLEAEGLRKAYGPVPLFADVTFRVGRGEKVGVVGPNGCGKSTLLKILAGDVLPDAGRVQWGHQIDLGHYDQQLRSVKDTNTVLEEVADCWPGATLGELRSFAGAFGFGAEMIDRVVGALSGGERGRLALMRLIRGGHNTLLLDEPTNHLDAVTCEALEEGLRGFDGTLVVVSHDRRFLDRVCDRILMFVPAGPDAEVQHRVQLHLGSWGEVSTRLRERAAAAQSVAKESKPAVVEEKAGTETGGGLSKNEIARREKWIAEVEEEIAALETEQGELLERLSSPELTPEERLGVS